MLTVYLETGYPTRRTLTITMTNDCLHMIDGHIVEELLEEYARALRHSDNDPVTARIEEHLLVCHWCQERFERIEILRAALRRRSDVDDAAGT